MKIPTTMWENMVVKPLINICLTLGRAMVLSQLISEKEYEENTQRVSVSHQEALGPWDQIQFISASPHSLVLWKGYSSLYTHFSPSHIFIWDEAESIKTIVCNLNFNRLWKRFHVGNKDLPTPWHRGLLIPNQRIWLIRFHVIHWCSLGLALDMGA